MKTLKLLRLISMAAGFLCLLISWLPQGDGGYDWPMIVEKDSPVYIKGNGSPVQIQVCRKDKQKSADIVYN